MEKISYYYLLPIDNGGARNSMLFYLTTRIPSNLRECIKRSSIDPYQCSVLTRHRVGSLVTHDLLGGLITPPPLLFHEPIVRRRETSAPAFESPLEKHLKHSRHFQAKVRTRSKGKNGAFACLAHKMLQFKVLGLTHPTYHESITLPERLLLDDERLGVNIFALKESTVARAHV